MSLRQRLKHTLEVANRYSEILGRTNLLLMETRAQHQAARHAARWYRERWIFTMIALIVVFGAVAIGLME